MPTFSAFSESHADAIAFVIAQKSVSTGTITRGSGTVSAKTGRLETLSSQRQIQGEGGKTYTIDAMILAEYGAGFKPGDRFEIVGQAFEVVIVMPGHIDCEQVYLILRR